MEEEEDGDVTNEIKFVVRRVELGDVGPLQAVRESTIEELLTIRHASLLPVVASAATPSAQLFVYNVSHRMSLRDLLTSEQNRETMTWDDSISYWAFDCASAGLSSLRQSGRKHSFHGDVQPSNVYVSSDFGRV